VGQKAVKFIGNRKGEKLGRRGLISIKKKGGKKNNRAD